MSVPQIMANIRALGFRVEDIKVILNSYAHFDHAGGIAAIQCASHAAVEERLAARDSGRVADLRDPTLCMSYIANARKAVLERFACEVRKP